MQSPPPVPSSWVLYDKHLSNINTHDPLSTTLHITQNTIIKLTYTSHSKSPEVNPTTNSFLVLLLYPLYQTPANLSMSPPSDKPSFPPTADTFDVFSRVLVLGEEISRFELSFELRAVAENVPKQLEGFVLDFAKIVEDNLDVVRRLYSARSFAAYGETKAALFHMISVNDRFWNTLQIKFDTHVYRVCGRIEMTELGWETAGDAPKILASMQKEYLISDKLLRMMKLLSRDGDRTAYELERGPSVRTWVKFKLTTSDSPRFGF